MKKLSNSEMKSIKGGVCRLSVCIYSGPPTTSPNCLVCSNSSNIDSGGNGAGGSYKP